MTRAQGVAGSRFEALAASPILHYVGVWVGAELFAIAASVVVAFHADRLAQKQRLVVMGHYFEHVLALPQAFHTERHSGSLLKVMFDGCNTMSNMWLTFFRETFTSFAILFFMLPLSIFINWQLALLLIG